MRYFVHSKEFKTSGSVRKIGSEARGKIYLQCKSSSVPRKSSQRRWLLQHLMKAKIVFFLKLNIELLKIFVFRVTNNHLG
jgi:hypothetical protein